MSKALLDPNLVFSSGNVYAPDEEELMTERFPQMQEAWMGYWDKMQAGQVHRISADPSLLEIESRGKLSSAANFRPVETLVGNDTWMDYHRPSRLKTKYGTPSIAGADITVSAGAVAAITISAPAGAKVGDLLLVLFNGTGGGVPVVTPPSGFSTIRDFTGTRVYYLPAIQSLSAQYQFLINTTITVSISAVSVTNGVYDTFTVSSTSTNPIVPQITTTSVGGTPNVVVVFAKTPATAGTVISLADPAGYSAILGIQSLSNPNSQIFTKEGVSGQAGPFYVTTDGAAGSTYIAAAVSIKGKAL